MIDSILKIFKIVKCYRCKKYFKKHKNTSCGSSFDGISFENFFYCNKCTNVILEDILKGGYKNETKIKRSGKKTKKS